MSDVFIFELQQRIKTNRYVENWYGFKKHVFPE